MDRRDSTAIIIREWPKCVKKIIRTFLVPLFRRKDNTGESQTSTGAVILLLTPVDREQHRWGASDSYSCGVTVAANTRWSFADPPESDWGLHPDADRVLLRLVWKKKTGEDVAPSTMSTELSQVLDSTSAPKNSALSISYWSVEFFKKWILWLFNHAKYSAFSPECDFGILDIADCMPLLDSVLLWDASCYTNR